MQMGIQFSYCTLYQVVGLEIYRIVGLVIDAFPQFLKLPSGKALFYKACFPHLACILGLYALGVENAVQPFCDIVAYCVIFFAKVQRSLPFVIVVELGELSLFGHIAFHAEGK